MDMETDIQKISKLLKPENLKKLQQAFDKDQLDFVLRTTMEKEFPVSTPYIEGLTEILFQDGGQGHLKRKEKEKIIIALLASGGGTANLAEHIYIALAWEDMKIDVDDIGNIILLTGIYTGVRRLAGGLRVLASTLISLNELAEKNDVSLLGPKNMIFTLAKQYAPAPLPSDGVLNIPSEPDITVQERA